MYNQMVSVSSISEKSKLSSPAAFVEKNGGFFLMRRIFLIVISFFLGVQNKHFKNMLLLDTNHRKTWFGMDHPTWP